MSNISYQGINEQFPVAGQDNDTQGFRDNFDTIKESLRIANEEITDLQTNVAKTDQDTDYNLKKIQNAVLENVRNQKLLGFTGSNINISPTIVDFQLGHYQIYKVGSGTGADPFVFDFLNFPGDPSLFGSSNIGVGKVILELYSDGVERTIAFRTSGITLIKKNNFPLMPVDSFGDLIVPSDSDPVFVEVWRWRNETIYVKYLGFLDTENTESFARGTGTSGPLLVKGTVTTFQDLPDDAEIGDAAAAVGDGDEDCAFDPWTAGEFQGTDELLAFPAGHAEFFRREFEEGVPECIAGVDDLHAAEEAAHAVSDEDHVVHAWVIVIRVEEVAGFVQPFAEVA